MNAPTAKVLVVDDERQIRRVMRIALATQGYAVSEARTGEEAIDLLRKERHDIVLLDLNMPGMGGMEACRIIRAESDIPIVVLSVRSSEQDKVEALDSGADDYVTKPFGEKELLARIRSNLRRVPRAAESDPSTLELDELNINLETRQVNSRGRQVRLTPKEFDLLQYLVSHPNVPLLHSRLLQAVWGPEYGSEVEYLRVFVNRLRKKIEPDPASPRFIVTGTLDRLPVSTGGKNGIVLTSCLCLVYAVLLILSLDETGHIKNCPGLYYEAASGNFTNEVKPDGPWQRRRSATWSSLQP